MAASAQDEIERLRVAQGEQFLKQMADMFQQTRSDLAAQYVPRSEMDHVNEAITRVANAVEKLTGNVINFHESAPRIFADRADTKQDLAELRTEIEKLKTARDADKERGYDYRFSDMQGRYKGDFAGERGWRQNAQQQSTNVIGWIIGISSGFLLLAINIIVVLALAHH